MGKHLWRTCLNYGPLSTHSYFPFESFYGDIIKLKSGTAFYQTNMMFASGYHQAATQLADKSNITNSTWQGRLMEKIGVPIQIIQNKYVYIKL